MCIRRRFGFCILLLLCVTCGRANQRTRLVLAATTSIEDSGLLDVLVHEFARAHPEIEVAAIAVGTGQAIELGKRGDADVLLSHDSVAEMQLVETGVARERRSVMYNDFLVVGPPGDSARARSHSAAMTLRAIAAGNAAFVSRGDDSGTHRRELQLWKETALDPRSTSWYIEAGVGMGDALLMAAQKRAYILTDRATYLSFRSRLGLQTICEGDPALLNTYGVTVLNGAHSESAQAFATWLTLPETQRLIGAFGRVQFGESLFKPSAETSAAR